MLTIIGPFLLFLINITLNSMEPEVTDIPTLSKEAAKIIYGQLKAQEDSLTKSMAKGAHDGFTMPWRDSFLLGLYLGEKMGGRMGKSEVPENIIDGLAAALLLAPIALALSALMPIPAMSYQTAKHIGAKIKVIEREKEFTAAVSEHLLQYIAFIKFAHLTADTLPHNKAVKAIEPSEKSWRKLEERLISFAEQQGPPHRLTHEDIKENLPNALYLFALNTPEHRLILKHFSQ